MSPPRSGRSSCTPRGALEPGGGDVTGGFVPEGAAPGPAIKPALTEGVSPHPEAKSHRGLGIPEGASPGPAGGLNRRGDSVPWPWP